MQYFPVEKFEEQFILRTGPTLAKKIHAQLSGKGKDTEVPVQWMRLDLKSEQRSGTLTIRDKNHQQQAYECRLVDLPCNVEALKTYDNINYYKSADVGQMILVPDPADIPEQKDEENGPQSPSLDPNSTLYRALIDLDLKGTRAVSGLTPPTKNIAHRKFRKIEMLRKQLISKAEKETKKVAAGLESNMENLLIVDRTEILNIHSEDAEESPDNTPIQLSPGPLSSHQASPPFSGSASPPPFSGGARSPPQPHFSGSGPSTGGAFSSAKSPPSHSLQNVATSPQSPSGPRSPFSPSGASGTGPMSSGSGHVSSSASFNPLKGASPAALAHEQYPFSTSPRSDFTDRVGMNAAASPPAVTLSPNMSHIRENTSPNNNNNNNVVSPAPSNAASGSGYGTGAFGVKSPASPLGGALVHTSNPVPSPPAAFSPLSAPPPVPTDPRENPRYQELTQKKQDLERKLKELREKITSTQQTLKKSNNVKMQERLQQNIKENQNAYDNLQNELNATNQEMQDILQEK